MNTLSMLIKNNCISFIPNKSACIFPCCSWLRKELNTEDTAIQIDPEGKLLIEPKESMQRQRPQ